MQQNGCITSDIIVYANRKYGNLTTMTGQHIYALQKSQLLYDVIVCNCELHELKYKRKLYEKTGM